MLIFQVNDDMKLSQEEYQRWKNYLQTNKVVLLPPYIDFICNTDTEEGEEVDFEEE